MVSRRWILAFSILGLAALSGCGGLTNANVKEKIITKEDMEKNMQQVTKSVPNGVKFPGINPPKGAGNDNPAKSPR